MLLLGVLAAQAEGAVAAAGSYDLLETEILTGTTSTITFSNINTTYGSDYQHLQIRAAVRSDSDVRVWADVNSDTGSNYSWHTLRGSGSSVTTEGAANRNGMRLVHSILPGSSVAIGYIVDILNPFSTTQYKTFRTLGGAAGVTNEISLSSASWRSTSALDSIRLGLGNSAIGQNSMLTGTRISIYGLRSA
jgi:hypothetical protein